MDMSEKVNLLVEALVKVQQGMKAVAQDGENPHFKSRYSTLAAVVETVRPLLAANGIVVLQPCETDGNPIVVKVQTTLLHVSGQWMKSTLTMTPVRADPQGIGSCVSYGRRYGICSMLGIVSDNDDDGESASGRGNDKPVPVAPRKLVEVKKPARTAVATNSTTTTTSDSGGSESASKATPAASKPNTRVSKIKTIFSLSAQSGETPDAMKQRIGHILGLKRPIRESSEIEDSKLDIIIESFQKSLEAQAAASKKKEAA